MSTSPSLGFGISIIKMKHKDQMCQAAKYLANSRLQRGEPIQILIGMDTDEKDARGQSDESESKSNPEPRTKNQ